MKLERYELKAEKSLMVFEFVSEGPKGEIPKLVQFGETNLKDFYNLAFGDKDSVTGEINDSVVSNLLGLVPRSSASPLMLSLRGE